MSSRDVLLLGGSSFIGTALANKLAREGRQVHVLTPNAPPAVMNLKTVIQATEITEHTERSSVSYAFFGSSKGESISGHNRLFFLCDLCVLCVLCG